MSDSIVLLIVVVVFSIILLLIDNNVLRFNLKKSPSINENEDFFVVKKNKALIAMLALKEPNCGKKKKEETYIQNGKNILKKTSFLEIQKMAIEDF